MLYENLSSIQPGASLADAAYAQLSEGILRNELPPGTSLSVPELSRRLGISRSPVREAVQRLLYDGLADYRGRSGTVVSSIDASDFVALLEVREVLEGLAAGLAARRATTDELSRLEEQADQFRSIGTDGEFADSDFVVLDMSFHQLIREMARNDELGILLGRTEARAHLSMHSLWSGVRHVEATKTEHANICSAILSRDPSRADAAARDHIEGLRTRVLAAIAEHGRRGNGELG